MQILIDKYNDLDEWISKIVKSTKRHYPFIGYDSEIVKKELTSLFYYVKYE